MPENGGYYLTLQLKIKYDKIIYLRVYSKWHNQNLSPGPKSYYFTVLGEAISSLESCPFSWGHAYQKILYKTIALKVFFVLWICLCLTEFELNLTDLQTG